MTMKRVLLATEDAESCRHISHQLSLCGFDHAVTDCRELADGLPSRFDLAILDVGARPVNSIDLLRSLRRHSSIPILILAAEGGVTECVVALELGADDYLLKPVDDLELVARIKALLRRACSAEMTPSQQRLVVGDIELDMSSRDVKQSGRAIDLTPVEFDLLKVLLSSAGTLVSREVISGEVFGRQNFSRNRAIDVHMSGLRRKLGQRQDGAERIRTIRGYGYIYTNGQHTNNGTS